MKRIVASIVLFAAVVAAADTWEPCFQPISGDKVVLNDKIYVLLSEEHFDNLITNMHILATIAEKRWKHQHATENGRSEWHGARKETIVTNGTKTTVYADGYRFVEKFTERKAPISKPLPKDETKPDYSKLPPRLRAAKIGVNYVREVK